MADGVLAGGWVSAVHVESPANLGDWQGFLIQWVVDFLPRRQAPLTAPDQDFLSLGQMQWQLLGHGAIDPQRFHLAAGGFL
jgi:hypothetical protein